MSIHSEREHQKKEKKQKILVQEKAKQALIELQKLQNQERREVWIKQENDARIKTCQLRVSENQSTTL